MPPQGSLQPGAEPPGGRQPFVRVGHGELRGGGGCRRPDIGGKIGDGEVHFVADARNHGNRRGNDRTGQLLVVESPEILERAAAARQDQHVAFVPGTGRLERRDDLRRRLRA